MKKTGALLTVISVLTLVTSAQSFAGRGMKWQGSGGWGMGQNYGRMYNPKSVETVSGEVVSVEKFTPMRRMSYGVHLMIKTDKETLSVHLGPGWYLENQDTKIEAKDKIVVKGSRIEFEGKPAIIAAEVKKGDEMLKLRDERGFPVWSGWKRR